jgi:hypothetical protein
MNSDLDAISVPDASMAMMLVPNFTFKSFATGDDPVVGGQTIFVHKVNVRSKPPLWEAVTCSCHTYKGIG